MNNSQEFLVITLIQRGESDNYILQRLLRAGVQDDEAHQLIYRLRHSNQAVHRHFDGEGFFLLIGILALLILIVWILLIQI